MYEVRLEVTTPGSYLIDVDRLIADNKSRNVELAELIRNLGIFEERGSGIDKVVMQAELFQFPRQNSGPVTTGVFQRSTHIGTSRT